MVYKLYILPLFSQEEGCLFHTWVAATLTFKTWLTTFICIAKATVHVMWSPKPLHVHAWYIGTNKH